MAEIREIIAAGKDLVLVLGKDDQGESAAIQAMIEKYLTTVDIVRFSKQADDDTKRIKDKISDHLRQLERQYDQDTLITHERHRKLLEDAAAELAQAAAEIRSGLTLDLVATRLRQAAELLAEMTGDSVDAGLVDTIFSRFV